MDTNNRKCWNLHRNNCGLIWLEEKLLGSTLKYHISIDRKMADIMSLSIDKTVYKSTCKSANLQWPSDHLEPRDSPKKSDPRTIFNFGSLIRKSEFGTRYFSRKAISTVTHFHRFISLFTIVNINSIISAAGGFKLWNWIHINWPKHGTKETQGFGGLKPLTWNNSGKYQIFIKSLIWYLNKSINSSPLIFKLLPKRNS